MMDIQAGHDFHQNGMVAPTSDLDISFDIHRKGDNYFYPHLSSASHAASPYPDGVAVGAPNVGDGRHESPTQSRLYNALGMVNGHDLRTPSKPHQSRHMGLKRGHISLCPADDAALERRARNLMKRWEQCPGYQQYRKRQPKDDDESKEKVWPPHLELAFCKALILFPPMGRKKMSPAPGEPAMGRNELIAWAIMKWTSEARDRKKVSSHIQVLRPMFERHNDPGLLKYFSNPSKPAASHRGCRSAAQAMNRHRQFSHRSRPSSSQYCYRNGTASASSGSTSSGVPVHTPRPDDIQEVCRFPSSYFSFVPNKFEMFVKQREKQIHLFTRSSRDCQGPDLAFEDIYHLRFDFPPLASELERGVLHSQVIFNNARICLAADSIPSGRDSSENELGVFMILDCDPKHVSHSEHLGHYFADFRARTRFYDDGALIADVPEHSDRDQRDQARPSYDADNKTLGNVYFGSVFWAERMYKLGRAMREAAEKRATGTIASDEAARALEQRVAESVKRLSAVQEIWAAPRDGSGPERRVIAVCWKFEHVRAESCFTTWRHVVAGPAGDLLLGAGPAPATAQPSLESKLASSLQEVFAQGPDGPADGAALHGFGFDLADDRDPFTTTAPPSFSAAPHFDLTDMAMQLPLGMTQHPVASPPATAAAAALADVALYPANHIDFAGGHINICMPDFPDPLDDPAAAVDLDMPSPTLTPDDPGPAHVDPDLAADLVAHFATAAPTFPPICAADHPARDPATLFAPFDDPADPALATVITTTAAAAQMDGDARAWACDAFPYFDVGFGGAPAGPMPFADGAGIDGSAHGSPVERGEGVDGAAEGRRTPTLQHPQPVLMQTGGRRGDGVRAVAGESV